MYSALSEFVTAAEQNVLNENQAGTRVHPVIELLSREEGKSQEAINTNRALKQVSLIDAAWLDELKSKILQTNAIQAASALAELRAYGSLLKAGYQVTPIPVSSAPTPDFTISDGPIDVSVEVQAKQFNDETEESLETHETWVASQPKSPGVTSYVHVVYPFGKPQPGSGDTTTTNAIKRLRQIKKDDRQFTEGKPAILWLDFQDLHTWNMSLTADQFQPLLSSKEHLTSGALWYAWYGWHGAPVFEQCHYSHLDLPSQIQFMEHDGRFSQQSKLSAVIMSFPNATMLAESPHQESQLPSPIRLRYLGLPWAGIQHSVAEWGVGLVRRTLLRDAVLICAIHGGKLALPAYLTDGI